MKTLVSMVLIAGVIALGLSALICIAAESPVRKWNTPEPSILSLKFPTVMQITQHKVSASNEEKAEGIKWINEMLNPSALPLGVNEHMLALKGCLQSSGVEPEEVVKAQLGGIIPLTNGFVVKYKIDGYAIHIIETRSHVIVGFRDLSDRPAKTSQADRISFMEGIAKAFLKPLPVDPIMPRKHTSTVTRVWWYIGKGLPLPNGPEGSLQIISGPKEPFADVHCETDGKSVVFEAYKILPFINDHMIPRFVEPPKEGLDPGSYRKVPDNLIPVPKQAKPSEPIPGHEVN